MAADKVDSDLLSRPIRLAAQIRGEDEDQLEHLFTEARVLVRLEEGLIWVRDARETFLFAVNQVLRFCPNVGVCVPDAATDLVEAANEVAARVHGRGHRVQVAGMDEAATFAAVVNIGTEVSRERNWVTVNSTGWVARVAFGGCESVQLAAISGAFNAVGASAAACLGAGGAFLTLAGCPPEARSFELSLFAYEQGPVGTLPIGPELPAEPLVLDGFLVGCGAVTNGWAYVVKRLPIVGSLEAVDRQSLGIENLGPYVGAGREWLGNPKAEMIASLLSPEIAVRPKNEEWEFFKIRLRYGVRIPAVIVNGLDNVETRHSVQRFWPEVLIDMAAGGLTSQVIVKPRHSDAICLLQALIRPDDELSWAVKAARETGLDVERILEGATTAITEEDVAEAPEAKRESLRRARREGRLVCGHVTEHNLHFEGRNANFAPAVPFVTGFSGVIGAAALMKWLMGYREDGVHFQYSFRSGHSQKLVMRCEAECECQVVRVSP